jgi:methionine-rich copper-binding protein CopC
MSNDVRTAPRATSACVGAVLAVVLSALVLLPLLAASPAQAHDALVSTSPADGSRVATPPDEVVLTFNQPALAVGTQLVVSGPDGPVQQGKPRLVDATVRQTIATGSPAGRYTVTWRVTSADGHPVSGTFSFTATAAGSGVPSPSAAATSTASISASTPSTDGTATSAGAATQTESTSSTSTGVSGGSGTSWAWWLVVAVLVLAGSGAAAVRLRRGHAGRRHG